jgi:cytochrome P450
MTVTDGPLEHRHVDRAREFEPTAHYPALRERCPLHHEADHDPSFFVLSRFDDIIDVLKEPGVWGNADGPGVFYQESGVLGTTDDPDHARHRRLLRPAFVPNVIELMAPAVTAITDELLDTMLPLGRGDFVELFAVPLPALAIAELLGVPGDQRDSFGRWSNIAVAALTGGDLAAYQEAKTALEDHVEAGVDTRLAALDGHGAVDDTVIGDAIPDDVLSRLAVALRNEVISLREARHLGYQLLVAGHETTTSLLGMMLYRLIEHPDVLRRLRADRTLLQGAIEEALRFDSPVHGLFRTNGEERTIHGATIPAGSKLQLLYASANRDPSRFPDPDEFLIDRERRELGRHIAFGWGIHHCIGAPLARLETRIAFDRLLDRMADIELAGEPTRNDSFVLHGLTSLPLRWRDATNDGAKAGSDAGAASR